MRKMAATANSVAVIDKALDLLECLSDGQPRTVAELSEAAGISKAAAYRILHTFERRGLVVTYERIRRYTIGHGLLAYAEAARRFDRLLAAARPIMHELWTHSGETVNLGIRSRDRVLYLEVIESSRGLRATGQAGSLDALHSTALGKAMLSRLPDEELVRIVGRAELKARTVHTVTEPNVLLGAIARVRIDGFAVDNEENEIGMRCVAAPIVTTEGQAIGALSISGPTSRITGEAVHELAALLSAACPKIVDALSVSRFNPRSSAKAT
jgi:IclR family acetate operon transcriptional repressor